METKNEILLKIKNSLEVEKNHKEKNSMGVSENFYNPYYLVGKCFIEEELDDMTENELYNLLMLARFASEVFY